MPMPRVSNRIPQPEPETLVIATAAATFLASAGKPISVEYLIGFLQRTNNFAAMCEHFDSLGYKYNREDLAKHIVEAVSQARAQQGFSMIAPPPRAVQHPIVLAQSVPATKQPPMTESVVHKTSLPQLPVPNKAPPHQPTAVPVKQSFVPTNSVMIGDSPSLTGPFGNIGNDAMDIEGPTTSTTDANQNGKATASGVLSTFSGLGRKSGGLFARTKAHVNEDEAKAPAALDHGTEAPEESTEPKQPLAEKISRKNAARVSKYDSTNIAKTILVIANRHPTEKGLNAHLLPLKENFPGQIEWDSDLSTIRWDIIDTEPIAVDNDMDGDDEGDGDSNAATNAVPVVPRTGSSRALTTISGIASMPNNFCATHTTSAPHQYAPPSSARVNHKRRTVNAASSAIDSPMEGPSKKRKNDHPPSNGDPFKHYACQWTHCGVKLHNFENLKRHMKLHKKKNELFNGYPCHWAGCVRPPTAQQINAAKGRRGGLSPMVWDFGTEAEWERHMEIHVEALKQSAGVGPPALSAGHPHSHHRMKQIPLTSEKDQESGTSDVDYLSDHKGAPITPVAKLSIDTHRFVPPTGFKPNRQFSIAHGNTPQRNKKYEALLEKAKILGAGYECPCAPEPTRELGPPVWRVLPPDWLPEK
ncbi:hypothetical protein FN846DRAFT_645783 [Sphaerosporella brunnea]|uniref:C2H2-type domain-containing protein n=1 Tax=Sphaerosporella brunnea TaxID=1250544 RepID=A0A5J5F0V9_9PEZI|nr:hypothetical protein FN846DRAFT_645783 [Sphaerosporella brunnea]